MKNVFKFHYSALLWVMLTAVIALALTGLVWNTYNLIYFINAGIDKIISYSLIVLATGALGVIAFSVAFFGRYVIKNDVLVTCFGVFSSKTQLTEITEVVHFKKSNKLVVYFADQKFSVVLIAPEKYDHFVIALRDKNPKIRFNALIDGQDTPV